MVRSLLQSGAPGSAARSAPTADDIARLVDPVLELLDEPAHELPDDLAGLPALAFDPHGGRPAPPTFYWPGTNEDSPRR
jgi:hypothetical protein